MNINLDPNLLPTRRHRTGQDPTITTAEVLGPMERDMSKSKFNPPVRAPDNIEQRVILKQVLKVAIIVAMSQHHYKFNNRTYRQVDGGPIGDIFAQAGARLVMVWWDCNFRALTNKVTINLKSGFSRGMWMT